MTPEQFDALLARACRGTALTPAEGKQLRTAITTLRQQARVDTTVWCLREELEEIESMYLAANRRTARYRAASPFPARLGPEMTPIGQVYVKPWGFGVGPDQITNLQTRQRCCACGTTEHGGRAFYENYRGQLFCWPCADGDRLCDCHQPPVRESQHVDPAPAPSAKDDGGTWRHVIKYLPRSRD